ncbi:MAG TPA: aromatic ring-hydroxylating dioxygenase subunit alpha [Rhizomicrobium sp.]|jgi:phenylpropionate dioxygenase-like ring-hydroxylating dioxygenase large terminal subunit|nr:aromatic ring-hydroxylating dioxygenase subunit alpha [Rhizomicrobium sp.]
MQARPHLLPQAHCDLRRVGTHPDFWYPLAWSHQVKPGRTLGAHFAGEPVVLYRGTSGSIFALEDRCAHRQVPLHLGAVAGDTLRCGYHGWTYDCAGRCIDVPYLGRERLPNGVRRYPAHEIDGMIFIFPGNPDLAEARKPAGLGSKGDRRYLTRRLNREVACHYTFMHENLFDMNHQFLHRRQMGMIRARCLGRRQGENWCDVDYAFSRTAGRGSIGESAILNAMEKKREAGRHDLMTIRTEYPYQRLKFWVAGGDPVLDVWLSYTPLDAEQRTNRTFGYLSVKKPRLVPLLYLAWPFITWFTENIFREDKDIVEREQAAHDAQGADWNNEIFPAIRDLRELLARCGVPRSTQIQ